MPLKLSELAEQTGVRLEGDGECLIERVSEISAAGTGDIAFVSSQKYVKYLEATNASAVILNENLLDLCSLPALVTDNPRLTYARVVYLLNPPAEKLTGISEFAIIADDAKVDKAAYVSAGAIIGSKAVIKAGAQIGAGCVIEEEAIVGTNTTIKSNVTIGYGCKIGDDCTLHSGIVIGADGFGFVKDGESYLKIPQLGSVHIGNNVEIGANSTIDRGAVENTIIGDNVKLDNLIQVGHGSSIGKNTVISGGTGVAGSTHIGSNCLIGGYVAFKDHITIADNVMITARTMVTRSLTEVGTYSSGIPVDTSENWRKNTARFRQLDKMARRITKLEKTTKENKD